MGISTLVFCYYGRNFFHFVFVADHILFPVLTNSCNLPHLLSSSPPKTTKYEYNKQTNKQIFNIVAAAIIGGYFGLYILIKIKGAISAGSAPVEEAAPVAAAIVPSSAGAIPGVDSEEFGAFLESEDNIMKLVESFEK